MWYIIKNKVFIVCFSYWSFNSFLFKYSSVEFRICWNTSKISFIRWICWGSNRDISIRSTYKINYIVCNCIITNKFLNCCTNTMNTNLSAKNRSLNKYGCTSSSDWCYSHKFIINFNNIIRTNWCNSTCAKSGLEHNILW